MDKEEKQFYFVAGLPRSGSTLLMNILGQNPRFHVTPTSGLLDLMSMVRMNWDRSPSLRAAPNDTARVRVLRGILENFHSHVPEPVVIDKNRGWAANIEMLEACLGHEARIIVPVRDIRDVLASFEKLYRRDKATGAVGTERAHPDKFQTIEGRLEMWMSPKDPVGPVGVSFNALRDAVNKGQTKQLLFVEYDRLTSQPEEVLKNIYSFLNEENFKHDFENVEQLTHEDDLQHGFRDLHTIRQKVEPQTSSYKEILGHASEKYAHLNFWTTPFYRAELKFA